MKWFWAQNKPSNIFLVSQFIRILDAIVYFNLLFDIFWPLKYNTNIKSI